MGEIYRRVEKVEIELAVLESKTNMVQEDIQELKADVKENGVLSREMSAQLKTMPRLLLIGLSALGLLFTAMTFVKGIIE